MARVVKKVKKTKEQKQRRNKFIARIVLAAAALTTIIILLVMFITRTRPAVDVFKHSDFDDFQIQGQQQLLDFLHDEGTQYVFIFIYNSEHFDKENTEHYNIYDRIRLLINEDINAINDTIDQNIDFTFGMINLNNLPQSNVTGDVALLLGNIGNLAFVTLSVADSGFDTANTGYRRIETVDAPPAAGGEDYSPEDISSNTASTIPNAIGAAIGLIRNWT